MSRRARVEAPPACPHCREAVREAVLRRSGRTIRLNVEPAAIGNIQIDELGFASFIPADARSPKHPTYVPPERRYISHQAACARNEHTTDPETPAFMEACERRLKVVR